MRRAGDANRRGLNLATGERADENAIEIRVEEVSQLFDTLDPFPFRERDLDREAEDYIVGWARELPGDGPIRIVVHLPANAAVAGAAGDLQDALHHFFAYRADAVARDLRELLRIGRRSLATGLAVLGLCLLVSQAVAGRLGSGELARFLEEGLVILGWVANWRPMEVFLYDWWPLVRRRRLYQRLAAATVVLRPAADASRPAPPLPPTQDRPR